MSGTGSTGRGRTFVDLVTGIERSMCTAVHTLPSVDHLAAAPTPPDDDAWQALEEHLTTAGAQRVVESLRDWRRLDGAFRAAAHRLVEIRGAESEPGCQQDLQRRIEDARVARSRLRVVAELESR